MPNVRSAVLGLCLASTSPTASAEKVTGTVRGVLVNEFGSPAGGVTVTLCLYKDTGMPVSGGGKAVMLLPERKLPKAETTPEGTFVLAKVPAGRYAVTLSDGVPCSGPVEAGTPPTALMPREPLVTTQRGQGVLVTSAPLEVRIDKPGQEVDLGKITLKR